VVGKTAILDHDFSGTFGAFNAVVRAKPGVEARFLYYWFQSSEYRSWRDVQAQGVNIQNIRHSELEALRLPLPAPSEQRRIVEILDQADRIRRLRTAADASADHILPAVLTRALGSPSTWPSHPRSRPLGSLVDPVSGATPSKTKGDYWNGTVPWVSPKDMKRDFLSDAKDHVSELALDETNLRVVERDNVLIVVRGMILARDVPVALNMIPVTMNQDMKALVPKSAAVTGAYVWAALRLAKASLQSFVRTAGHGTRKLDTPELMQFPLIEPSAKQLAQVDAAVHEHRQYIRRREASRTKIDKLFAVLVSRAFDGSLTSSWREAHMNELLQELEQQAKALAEA
jgi:type I restriction enzyme S subunit